jgi:hypothetical protein
VASAERQPDSLLVGIGMGVVEPEGLLANAMCGSTTGNIVGEVTSSTPTDPHLHTDEEVEEVDVEENGRQD